MIDAPPSSFVELLSTEAPMPWREAAGALLGVLDPLAVVHRRDEGYGGRLIERISVRLAPAAEAGAPPPPKYQTTFVPLDPPESGAAAVHADLLAWFELLRMLMGAPPESADADGVFERLVPLDVATAAALLVGDDPRAVGNASVLRAVVALALDLPLGVAPTVKDETPSSVLWGTSAVDDATAPEADVEGEPTGDQGAAHSGTAAAVVLALVVVCVIGYRAFVQLRLHTIPSCDVADDCRTGNCANGYCAPLGMVLITVPRQSVDPALQYDVFMATTEVTQAEFRTTIGANPSYFDQCGPNCPVESVSVYEAIRYLNTLSRREGLPECYELVDCAGDLAQGCDEFDADKANHGCDGSYACGTVRFAGLDCSGYRLPTTAEWQVAAMGLPDGTTLDVATALTDEGWTRHSGRVEYAGGMPCPDDDDPGALCGPTRVDSDGVNAWGLHHMAGNVQEWVYMMGQDVAGWEADDPLQLGRSAVTGGAWAHTLHETNVAHYVPMRGDTLFSDLGFRVARTAYRSAVR